MYSIANCFCSQETLFFDIEFLAESTFASTAILFASDYIGGSVPRHLNPETLRQSCNFPAVMASLAVSSIAKQKCVPLADKL
jgi:hypothetical protein